MALKSRFTVIGQAVPRLDALPKATGSAVFATDLELPHMLWGKILRSPFPHARIVNIDTTRAKRLPGVRQIITGMDCPSRRYGQVVADENIMTVSKVRYLGDEIAAVAAQDEETAEEALT